MSQKTRPGGRAFKLAVYLSFALAFFGLVGIVALIDLDPWQYSRQMDCGKQTDERAREICESIERHVEYTCCGHAIISPGYRSTWATVVGVWCEQRVQLKDMTALRTLTKSNDARLTFAAESLLQLLTGHDQYGTQEAENSIFHPANPSYLLRNGCKGQDVAQHGAQPDARNNGARRLA